MSKSARPSGSRVLPPDDHYRFPHLLAVAASAGSGKTQALASRFIQFLLSQRVPHRDLAHLLAVTFTNNAAREMKERILSWLKALALRADDSLMRQTAGLVAGTEAEIASRAGAAVDEILDRYGDFQVQTIDSFCRMLFAASGQESGQRPDFDLVFDYSEMIPPALDLLLKPCGRDPQFDRMVRDFLDAVNRAGGSAYLWDPRQALERRFAVLLDAEAREAGTLVFRDRAGEIERLAAGIIARAEAVIADGAAQGLMTGESPLLRDLKRRDYPGACAKAISARTLPLKGRRKGDPAADRLVERWLSLAGRLQELAEACSLNRASAFGPLFALFKRELEGVKRRSGVVHIDDLAAALGRHLDAAALPEVYLRLGCRLYHFLIDEFQDTSPLQWRALRPLLEEALAGDGSLFLVGDLKQAIYMFRRADYRIMAGLLDEIAGRRPLREVPASVAASARTATLDTNYRSGGAIVDYVGRVFRENLPAAFGAGPDPTGLGSAAQATPGSRRAEGYVRVRHYIAGASDGEDDGGQAVDERVREDLVAIVRDARARGHRYGGIAVLAGRNLHLERAVDWLNGAGIPVASSSALDIRSRKVVAEIASLLAFLDSPIDDTAFFGFASGLIARRAAAGLGVDIDPAGLSRMMAERSGAYAYQSFRQHPTFRAVWDGCLEPLYQRSGYYPLYGLLCLALRLLRVFDNFPEESGALIRLLETANRLEGEGEATIGRFLDRVAGETGDLFSQELPEYNDAVRLLTFHKAKGLGFPVTVNLLYDSPIRGETEYFRAEGEEVRLYHLPAGLRSASPALAAIYEESRAANQVQKLNELYVCCTRARDELYNLVIAPAPDSPLVRLFPEAETGARRRARHPAGADERPVPAFLPPAGGDGSGWTEAAAGGEGWSRQRLRDARTGEACHAALAAIEYCGAGGEVAAAIGRLRAGGALAGLDDGQAGWVQRSVAAFLELAPARGWFTAKPGREVLREAEFVGVGGRRLRMDRVVLDPGQATLIEFKTGEPADHRAQVDCYREILSAVYPGRTIAAFVAHVDRGLIEEVA